MLGLWLLVACGAGADAVLWNGFDYRWDLLSHRISYISTISEADGGLRLGLVGGDWSTGEAFTDAPWYRMRTLDVRSSSLAVAHGETELTVGPEGSATGTGSTDDAAVLAMPAHAVLLRGFVIDTDVEQSEDYPSDSYDPAYGYTSRGFGFAVGEASDVGGSLEFPVDASVRWGPQDREDMNAAIPFANTGVTVAWTVVGFEGEAMEQAFSASIDEPYDAPYSPHQVLGEGELDLSMSNDYDHGFPGISAFDLLVEDLEGSDEGDYLRSFGLELVQTESTDDEFHGYARADASNSSALEYMAMRLTATGTARWIGLAGRDTEVVPRVTQGFHAVGTLEVPAPL